MTTSISNLTRRQKVEEREHAILESARRVFFAKGYEGARMSEIAAGANIAEGTIYIYYKSKAALMRAVVSEFWIALTAAAWAEVSDIQSSYEALESLARFHLNALIEQSDMIDLTQSLRATKAEVGTRTEELKSYVRVFDTIMARAVDLGELIEPSSLWVVRDVFFGSLDYSARTLRLHDSQNLDLVISNLVDGIWRQFAVSTSDQVSPPRTPASDLVHRLEQAVQRLENVTVTPANTE